MTDEPRTMTTYRRKDGEPIEGMYGWVDDLEFFGDHSQFEPVELVKEVWVRQSVEEMTYPPPCKHVWDDGECVECGAEREVVSEANDTAEQTG